MYEPNPPTTPGVNIYFYYIIFPTDKNHFILVSIRVLSGSTEKESFAELFFTSGSVTIENILNVTSDKIDRRSYRVGLCLFNAFKTMNLVSLKTSNYEYARLCMCKKYHHHHHHVVLVARISLTLSRHFSLSFIASGRSSGQRPVSSHSY